MIFKRGDERRREPRRPVNLDGVVHGPGYEVACRILDLSEHGMRVRLDRQAPPPPQVVVIEIAGGVAHEVETRWREGMEAGFRILSSSSLRGLTPARLTAAREAWRRAGGR
jgi:hypothetical protein